MYTTCSQQCPIGWNGNRQHFSRILLTKANKRTNSACMCMFFFCMLQNRPSSISVSRREWLIYEQRTEANVLFWGGTNDIPTHQQGEKGVKILFTKDGTFYLYEDDDSALVSWCALLMNEHSSSRINSGWSKRGHCVPVLFRSVQASSDRQNEQIQKKKSSLLVWRTIWENGMVYTLFLNAYLILLRIDNSFALRNVKLSFCAESESLHSIKQSFSS